MSSQPFQPLQPHAPATLDHAGIAARVPHAGRMCLLDELLHWSTTHITCSVSRHADPAHPLRTASGLLSPCAIEYAGQAMALHGTLCAASGTGLEHSPLAGFLAAARSVVLHSPRLDTAPGPLQVSAERLVGDDRQALYSFKLHDAAGRLLVEGRATVVLDGTPGASTS